MQMYLDEQYEYNANAWEMKYPPGKRFPDYIILLTDERVIRRSYPSNKKLFLKGSLLLGIFTFYSHI